MTAPSLLDELEGVVKFLLGERPLDGRWFGDDPPVTASGLKRRYWWRADLRRAHAAMAKRLEAAERDAARYRWLRTRIAGREQVAEMVEYNDMGGRLPLEVDAAIDAATQEAEG